MLAPLVRYGFSSTDNVRRPLQGETDGFGKGRGQSATILRHKGRFHSAEC